MERQRRRVEVDRVRDEEVRRQVTFRPGAADKSKILEVLGGIRQRTHDFLMKRAMPKW